MRYYDCLSHYHVKTVFLIVLLEINCTQHFNPIDNRLIVQIYTQTIMEIYIYICNVCIPCNIVHTCRDPLSRLYCLIVGLNRRLLRLYTYDFAAYI